MRVGLLLLALCSAPAWAQSGTAVAEQVRELGGRDRQAAFLDQLLARNTPAFLDRLHRVTWVGEDANGLDHTVSVDATCDYVAIGSDADFLRVPLDWPTATAVAREWQMVAPTARIVDQLWAAATQRLAPRPMAPGPTMRSVPAYLRHRTRLLEQGAVGPTDGLRAGHKKDLVLTRELEEQPDRVAIYGWHRNDGEPIQPLSLWHGAGYTDYSHGLRLIAPTIQVDGEPRDLFEVLADPVLCALVTDEGPWEAARQVMWPDGPPTYPEYRP